MKMMISVYDPDSGSYGVCTNKELEILQTEDELLVVEKKAKGEPVPIVRVREGQTLNIKPYVEIKGRGI